MKKALVAIALAAVASTASAAIAGGSHDMTTMGGTLSSCWYCHAPHFVNTGVPGAPLWNRATPAGPFTVYSSGTLNDTNVALGANSYTCLSCHDGVTDLGSMYTGTTENLGTVTPYANVGTNLGDDHPVGVNYIEGGEFATRANAETAGMVFYSYVAGSYSVECGSCHDPHGTSDGATGGAGFLRAPAASMCSACHLK